jgi:protein-S-isoprenylcysteine O-methyltransferase Ste14
MNGYGSLALSACAWLACLLGISLLKIGAGGTDLQGPAAVWVRVSAHPPRRALVQWFLHRRTRFGAALAAACLLVAFLNPHRSWNPWERVPAIAVALVLMLSGAVLRMAALGVIHKRERLATTGVYSLCRHPLYVGTILIVFGACALIPQPLHTAVALVYFLAFYPLTIAKEEFQSAERFGADYDAYRASTPLVLPIGRWRPAEGFDWHRALWKGGVGALLCVLAVFTTAEVLHRWSPV